MSSMPPPAAQDRDTGAGQPMTGTASAATDYDVVVIGGAFSGAATALLLRRFRPATRVLIVERAAAFDRKVGEATVEMSAMFLHKVLGLYDFLSREELPKHGLRYWFTDRLDRSFAEMSEVGAMEVPRLPTFQLDRAKLDEHLLSLAVQEGAELVRPAKVAEVDLGWPRSAVGIVADDGTARTVSTRWLVDASGRHAFLGRRLGLHQRVEEHPTAAVWGRFTGVKDMDGSEVMGPDPRKPRMKQLLAARRLATNHFCGWGFWCWLIPLAGGETSVGLVYNKELFSLGTEGTLRERFLAFLAQRPGLRELTAGAVLDPVDFKSYTHLPYRTRQYMSKGWAMVGDAAGFIDPYYSPGLDHCSMSVYSTVRVLEDELSGRLDEAALDARVFTHNDRFVRSYGNWIDGLYVGKYELMGDAELLGAAFLIDTALYYTAIVTPAYKDPEQYRAPTLGEDIPQVRFAYWFIKLYSGRLRKLAALRRRAGTYGRKNAGWALHHGNFGLGLGAWPNLLRGLALWWRAELDGLWLRLRPWRWPAVPPDPSLVGAQQLQEPTAMASSPAQT